MPFSHCKTTARILISVIRRRRWWEGHVPRFLHSQPSILRLCNRRAEALQNCGDGFLHLSNKTIGITFFLSDAKTNFCCVVQSFIFRFLVYTDYIFTDPAKAISLMWFVTFATFSICAEIEPAFFSAFSKKYPLSARAL